MKSCCWNARSGGLPGTMQNNILSGAETGEKGFVYGEKYSISEHRSEERKTLLEIVQKLKEGKTPEKLVE